MPWPTRALAQELGPSALVLVNLSGRGDKDVDTVARLVDQEGGSACLGFRDAFSASARRSEQDS